MARKKVQPCRHCGNPISFPEPKPGAQRASRPKFCSDRCRLYSKVDTTPGHGPKGECHVYTGAKHKFGYGMINRSGSKASEITTAHVYAWEISNGPVPDGMFVLHECDYPPCCREGHLFLGTHQDNVDDMDEKGRRVVERLTKHEVRQILNELGTDLELAQKFGCSEYRIWSIRTGRTWSGIK